MQRCGKSGTLVGSFAESQNRVADAKARVDDFAVGTLEHEGFFGAERAFRKLDEFRRTHQAQVRQYRSGVFGSVIRFANRSQIPLISGRVLHSGFAVAIGLFPGSRERSGASFQRALIDCVDVVDMQNVGYRSGAEFFGGIR